MPIERACASASRSYAALPLPAKSSTAKISPSSRCVMRTTATSRCEKLLPASYNLAAIYAQAGQKEKALALLQRHFFEYERYQEVRSKEMMEARVDAVFASLINDPAFLALTKDADGRLPMRMSP